MMSDCDSRKNIKKAEPTVENFKSYWRWAAHSHLRRHYCHLRAVGKRQDNELLTFTSLLYLLSFDLMIKEPIQQMTSFDWKKKTLKALSKTD